MKTAEIRSAYLRFFAERGHRIVPSSPLVPRNDPTLLFTNSGMVQFKDALIGREQLGFARATSAQRCVRAGGKHNDLENVGYTVRHHTFFEMMGNFSFGDYFKEEAIAWAWEFVTGVLAIPKERLWVTVHPDDADAKRLWIDKIGFPPERVVPIADNFWAMGDTGPCGPCSEIFYDHGPSIPGGPPGSPDEDGDRFVEFWNLVFPQFDRSPDGTLTPLPKPGVDTGMGLERVAAIKQGVPSNYDIDVFQDLLRAAAEVTGVPQDRRRDVASLRVIADHIRSCAFLIADGVTPSNEDRGYVLRRIIRRALRHGYMLGVREPFFHRLVAPLVAEMAPAYPLLGDARDTIERALLAEERRFAETLDSGMKLLNETIEGMNERVIPGDVVFKLYDTFGFPVDLTADVARERGLEVDMAGFERAMEEQRERGRAASKFDADVGARVKVDTGVEFLGYDTVSATSRIVGLYRRDGDHIEQRTELRAGEAGIVLLDRTPFYAEAGGQIGDRGELVGRNGKFEVADTKLGGAQHLHQGAQKAGVLRVGDDVTAVVDAERRRRTALNHSATHLLHAALRKELGQHVEQKGSLVEPDRLRFDFSHSSPLTREQIQRIEAAVNREIQRNTAVDTAILGFDEAMDRGAMALFGEKYGDRVRVLTMGEGYSVELCGGTHVDRTGDIGLMRVVSESGIAAGIRRIEAVTGPGALTLTEESDAQLESIVQLVKGSRRDVTEKVRQLLETNRMLQRELEQLRAQAAAAKGSDLAQRAVDVSGVKVLAARLDGVDGKALLTTLDALKDRLGSAVIVLGQVDAGKVNLIAGVTKDLTHKLKAGDLVATVGAKVGARGGGRPDMARAGGGERPEALTGALESVATWVAERVAANG